MKYQLSILLLAAATATAQAATDPAQWGNDAAKAYAECSFGATIVTSWREAVPEDFDKSRACVQTKMDATKVAYQALPPIRPQSAKAALTDYYAAWIGAMQSIPHLLNMPKRQASVVDTANSQRLNELWARFQIESGR